MSPIYESKVQELKQWYAERLPSLGAIHMIEAEYSLGTDFLPETHRPLIREAFDKFKSDGYELSYRQDCIAFFSAAKELGLLVVE